GVVHATDVRYLVDELAAERAGQREVRRARGQRQRPRAVGQAVGVAGVPHVLDGEAAAVAGAHLARRGQRRDLVLDGVAGGVERVGAQLGQVVRRDIVVDDLVAGA